MRHGIEHLESRQVPPGALAVYWLCQAGFVFKTSAGLTVCIDPYLSDVVERIVGFKRMMLCPVTPAALAVDLVVCTHEHLDHMDTDALPVLARNEKTHFAGPVDCIKEIAQLGIAPHRLHLLEVGKPVELPGATLTAVYADHADLSPNAVGVILELDGLRIYHTGDTAFRPEEFATALNVRPDLLLPCINGAFGNMDARQAAELTRLARPRVAIPTHFWMFVEQNGNPGEFLEACSRRAPETRIELLKPGEEYLLWQQAPAADLSPDSQPSARS